jgi:hypothetical protein
LINGRKAMKNYFFAFLLALLVVLSSVSVRQSVLGIGGTPPPVPPFGIGGTPPPVPPFGIGGTPPPVPPF